jgi:hypothetical protein
MQKTQLGGVGCVAAAPGERVEKETPQRQPSLWKEDARFGDYDADDAAPRLTITRLRAPTEAQQD